MRRFSRLFRFSLTCSLWLLVFCLPLRAQEQTGLPEDLQKLICEAVAANPAVKEKAQITTAAKEAIRPAGAFDNPEVSVGLLNLPVDTFAFNQVDMTNAPQIAVKKSSPSPGRGACVPSWLKSRASRTNTPCRTRLTRPAPR